MKGGKFLDYGSECYLVKKDSMKLVRVIMLITSSAQEEKFRTNSHIECNPQLHKNTHGS